MWIFTYTYLHLTIFSAWKRAFANQQWLFGNKYLIELKLRCDHYFKLKIEILSTEKCHCLLIVLPIHEGPGYH